MLAFVRGIPGFGKHDLWVRPTSQGEESKLNQESYAVISGLAWTPDGRELIYIAHDTVWRIAAEGGDPQPVSTGWEGTGTFIWQLSLSPKGDRLIYSVWSQPRTIWRFPGPRSAETERVVSELIVSNVKEGSVDFSPNSRKIAFVSERAGRQNIWVCDADGQANFRQLTFRELHTSAPSWSPNGEWIAFESSGETGFDIFVIPASGVGATHQITASTGADLDASWSQDGRWIYLTSDRTGEEQIWRVPVERGQAKDEPIQVTKKGGVCAQETSSGDELYFGKPDGSGVWKVPTGGGEEVLVLDRKVKCGNWDPTEESIYFASTSVIERFDLETGKTTRVLERNTQVRDLTVSPDGEWIVWDEQTQNEADLMLVENFR
jgi:Tol biopolymer transport system component